MKTSEYNDYGTRIPRMMNEDMTKFYNQCKITKYQRMSNVLYALLTLDDRILW